MSKNKQPITVDFLLFNNFSKAKRYFCEKNKQFRVYYEIEGYDCQILITPAAQTLGQMPPEEQIEEHSKISFLEKHHIGDWQIYVNTLDNHLTTFNYCKELIKFMKICKTPLRPIRSSNTIHAE